MEYTTLNNSDLRVSRICLGTWLFGGRRWGKVDADDSRATLEHALDRGITFFDTADAYGEGLAEDLLGDVLGPERKNVVIATKVGVVWRKDGTRYIDLSARHIAEAVRNSLRRLKTDYIDLYQMHEMDPITPIEETGGAMRRLVDEGLVRYIGVSNFDTSFIEQLRDSVPVLTVQSEYNLFKRAIESDIIPYCRKTGLSLLTYSPLQRGLLSGKFSASSVFTENDNRFHDDDFRGEIFIDNIMKVKILVSLSEQIGRSPSQTAIRWLLDNDAVEVVICGARRPEQLTDNVGAAGWSLKKDTYRAISDIFR